MKPKPAPAISAQRFARYVLWVQLMLIWVAGFLVPLQPSQRHTRQRAWFLCTDRLARMVRNLIVLRAAQMAGGRRTPRQPRNDAWLGFRRRMRVRNLLRAAAGHRLRRALNHRHDVRRLKLLLDVLANLDAHAATLVRRLKRGLSKLRPFTIAHRLEDAIAGIAAPAPIAADSS